MAAIAAPRYISDAITNASQLPPGHRFSLYFAGWDEATFELTSTGKAGVLSALCSKLPPYAIKQLASLRFRQVAFASALADNEHLSLSAKTIGPMNTGMGIEHPLENGFAFLNPYGLAYLPGSSIKGVLRLAAEQLSHDHPDSGWTPHAVDVLFGVGSDSSAEHAEDHKGRQGALQFWDCLPELAGDALCVEIMTPHYSDYYQGKTSPHDAGQPNPIVFLAIPQDSLFSFQVTANTNLISSYQDSWQDLMKVAFVFAFDWLGFGAKTSLGYGLMAHHPSTDEADQETLKNHQQAQEKQQKIEALSQANSTLSEMAQSFEKQALEHDWDNNAQSFQKDQVIESWLEQLEALDEADAHVTTRLVELIDKHFPKGLLNEPEAVKAGKKPKPKYKPRQTKFALRLNAMRQSPNQG